MESKKKPVKSKRSDYKAPEFTATQVDLSFDLGDEITVVRAAVRYKRATPGARTALRLDGEGLVLKSLLLDGAPCKYKDTAAGGLVVDNVPDEFELEIVNEISPIANTELMGLYKSNGIFCTQCEPHGFRRITYFQDRPDILSRYRVKITGPDFGCGVLLSNGNLVDSGTLKGRNFAVWEDPFPKPCYLFALVAGTFDIVSDQFKTAGGKTVELNLYVDRGWYERGLWAMECLKDAMRWDEERFGLEYDLDNFKIVAVDFFNQGAMENKSLNIFNSVFVAAEFRGAADQKFAAVQSVIGHEYFHNYTGDRVTLRDWFQLSLKESLTVFRDQEFSAAVGDRTLTRLKAIRLIRGAQFSEDAGPMAHPVRPEEILEMNNFYTVTIYDKGAEIIRMIHTLIGEEKFKVALREYLREFDGQAVTIDDFVGVMSRVGAQDLTQFMRWYTQSGTPQVTAQWQYLTDTPSPQLELTLSQSTPPTPGQPHKDPFVIPIRTAFMRPDGSQARPEGVPANGVLVLHEPRQSFRFNATPDTFPLLLEDFSAPIKLTAAYTPSQLVTMMRFATDPFIKVDSAVRLTELYLQKQLAAPPEGTPDPSATEDAGTQFVQVCGQILADARPDGELTLINEVVNVTPLVNLIEQYSRVDLDALAAARTRLEQTLALTVRPQWERIYQEIKAVSPKYSVAAAGQRALNLTALRMLAMADLQTNQAEAAAQRTAAHYDRAQCMTDQLGALQIAVHLHLTCAPELLHQFEQQWDHDALIFDDFFRVQATAPDPETVFQVRRLLRHPLYDDTNPNRIRALPGAMALNPIALHRQDGAGYALLAEIVTALQARNSQVAARILTPMLSYRRFDERRQQHMRAQLEKLRALPNLSRAVYEMVDAALSQDK